MCEDRHDRGHGRSISVKLPEACSEREVLSVYGDRELGRDDFGLQEKRYVLSVRDVSSNA